MKRTAIQFSTLPRVRAVLPKKPRCHAYEAQISEYRRDIRKKVIRYIASRRFPCLIWAVYASLAQLLSVFVISATPAVAMSPPKTPVQPPPPYIKIVKMLPELPQASLSPVDEIAPITPPPAQNVVASPTGGCVTGVTMSDYYANLVMQRESGGRSCAMGPMTNLGQACGLFQALPCSKMGCSLSDVACQESWGMNYISSVYGSSANAWAHELNYGWY